MKLQIENTKTHAIIAYQNLSQCPAQSMVSFHNHGLTNVFACINKTPNVVEATAFINEECFNCMFLKNKNEDTPSSNANGAFESITNQYGLFFQPNLTFNHKVKAIPTTDKTTNNIDKPPQNFALPYLGTSLGYSLKYDATI